MRKARLTYKSVLAAATPFTRNLCVGGGARPSEPVARTMLDQRMMRTALKLMGAIAAAALMLGAVVWFLSHGAGRSSGDLDREPTLVQVPPQL